MSIEKLVANIFQELNVIAQSSFNGKMRADIKNVQLYTILLAQN